MYWIPFQMGYKDGVHDGRESQFQKGFDDGYEQGFKNGFLLGKYKGRLSTEQSSRNECADSSNRNDLILHRPSRGQCILCTNHSLKDDSISDIIDKQVDHMKRIESTLSSRYDTNSN